jgi:hypothetical protein
MDERDYKAMNEELNQPSCLGGVMRSSSEIQSRIDEINATIKQMTQERWKSTDKSYIDHLCNEISNLQGQRDSLVWVRNYA